MCKGGVGIGGLMWERFEVAGGWGVENGGSAQPLRTAFTSCVYVSKTFSVNRIRGD